MIRSFGDQRTEALFRDEFVSDFQGFARPAKRKLAAVHAAFRLEDLAVPSSNRLERLKGEHGVPLDPHQRSVACCLPMDRWRCACRLDRR